jgi:hypothetical protein
MGLASEVRELDNSERFIRVVRWNTVQFTPPTDCSILNSMRAIDKPGFVGTILVCGY